MNDEVEKVWKEFWEPIVIHNNGELDLDQIKKELYDFHVAMENVPKVYTHITGNKLSKITYKAEKVIDEADCHYEQFYNDLIADARSEGYEEGYADGREDVKPNEQG